MLETGFKKKTTFNNRTQHFSKNAKLVKCPLQSVVDKLEANYYNWVQSQYSIVKLTQELQVGTKKMKYLFQWQRTEKSLDDALSQNVSKLNEAEVSN